MRLAALAFALLISACASSGSSTSTTTPQTSSAPRPARANVISADEITVGSYVNVFEVVITLRPNWPKVPAYVRGARIAYERLQEIRAADVREIRLLSVEEARVRFGPEAQQTILVVTK